MINEQQDLSIILSLIGGGKKIPQQNNKTQNNNAQNINVQNDYDQKNDAQNDYAQKIDAQNNNTNKSQNNQSIIEKELIESFAWCDLTQNIELIINFPCKLIYNDTIIPDIVCKSHLHLVLCYIKNK